MSRISFSADRVIKRFGSQAERDREAAFLSHLSCTQLSDLTPKVIGISELEGKSGKQYLLSMSRIAGTPLSDNPLNEGLVEQLASVLAACHQSYEFSCFGSLTGELLIEDAQDEFGEFLINQLQKWTSRLTEFSTQYAEVVAILARLAEQHHASLNRFVPAVFSHNDFDLKNVLHVRGKIVGLIDWEHAGAYPFAWEMRKLYPALYWEKSDWSTQFQTRYLSQCPKTAMPNTSEQALLVAVDCIGALSWAYRKRTQSEVDRIRQLLNKALAMLSKGVSNE